MQAIYRHKTTIRALRNGDRETVELLFGRLSARSREQRFCVAKPRLTETELTSLALVDGDHHVLVGYVDGDAAPAGVARLVRDGAVAEIAVSVADVYQGCGVGSALIEALAEDARAAGITRLHATVCGDNPRIGALFRKVSTSIEERWVGRERELQIVLG
jgi:GNAT superfamily N-acetyltransferase